MPTLVLLSGLACDERLWQAQLPVLPAYLHPRVSDVHMRHASIEAMASAVLAEHDGPLVLCGTSMGGMVAMAAARQAPERVVGLALLGASARPEATETYDLRAVAIEQFALGEARDLIEANVVFAFHPTQAADETLTQRYVTMVLDAGVDQLIAQYRALMNRPDARPHLGALRCPVLVVCGDADRLTHPECSREIKALVPHAELSWVRDCGHMLTMEKPEVVNAVLRNWLLRLPD